MLHKNEFDYLCSRLDIRPSPRPEALCVDVFGHILKGLGDSVATYSRGIGFTAIRDSVLMQPGNKEYYDRQAKAPYMYNAQTRQFITYDNLWSVKKKCQFVKKEKLGGVMFWEYDSDAKGYLLNEINRLVQK